MQHLSKKQKTDNSGILSKLAPLPFDLLEIICEYSDLQTVLLSVSLLNKAVRNFIVQNEEMWLKRYNVHFGYLKKKELLSLDEKNQHLSSNEDEAQRGIIFNGAVYNNTYDVYGMPRKRDPEVVAWINAKLTSMDLRLTPSKLQILHKRVEAARDAQRTLFGPDIAGKPPVEYQMPLLLYIFKNRLLNDKLLSNKLVNFSTTCHEEDSENPVIEELREKLDSFKDTRIKELVVGPFGMDRSGSEVVEFLSEHAKELQHLDAIFLGKILYENEMLSDIQHGDITPIFKVFPNIHFYRHTGACGLGLDPFNHERLVHLTLITGGMDISVLNAVFKCYLPNLYHLELWLGNEERGYNGLNETFEDFLSVKERGMFPNLQYLGFRNFENIDELCPLIVDSAIARRVRILDLSRGELTWKGGEHLLKLHQGFELLELLDISHHFIYGGEQLKKIMDLPMLVDANNFEREKHRYVSAAE